MRDFKEWRLGSIGEEPDEKYGPSPQKNIYNANFAKKSLIFWSPKNCFFKKYSNI